MGKGVTIPNNLNLYGLIKSNGPRKPSVNEAIKQSVRTLIRSQDRRAEHLRKQSSCSTVKMGLPKISANESMQVSTSTSSEQEVTREMVSLERYKGSGLVNFRHSFSRTMTT